MQYTAEEAGRDNKQGNRCITPSEQCYRKGSRVVHFIMKEPVSIWQYTAISYQDLSFPAFSITLQLCKLIRKLSAPSFCIDGRFKPCKSQGMMGGTLNPTLPPTTM